MREKLLESIDSKFVDDTTPALCRDLRWKIEEAEANIKIASVLLSSAESTFNAIDESENIASIYYDLQAAAYSDVLAAKQLYLNMIDKASLLEDYIKQIGNYAEEAKCVSSEQHEEREHAND